MILLLFIVALAFGTEIVERPPPPRSCGIDFPARIDADEAKHLVEAYVKVSNSQRPPMMSEVKPGSKLPYDMFADYIAYNPIFVRLNTKACKFYGDRYVAPHYKIEYILDANLCRVKGVNDDGSFNCTPALEE